MDKNRGSKASGIPSPGWWKGLEAGRFYTRLLDTRWPSDPAQAPPFTHHLIQKGKVVGRLAAVEFVEDDPSPCVRQLQLHMIAFVQFLSLDAPPTYMAFNDRGKSFAVPIVGEPDATSLTPP